MGVGAAYVDNQREALRQAALTEIALLDTPPEREFDVLAKLAQRILGTGMSSITLIAPERQWFKARCGPLAPETTRALAFCPIVVETEAPAPLGCRLSGPEAACELVRPSRRLTCRRGLMCKSVGSNWFRLLQGKGRGSAEG